MHLDSGMTLEPYDRIVSAGNTDLVAHGGSKVAALSASGPQRFH
jgi:hypothetical protein